MQTAIVYYSKHHGNTKKLLDAIAQQWDVALIDAAGNPNPDLSAYDLIALPRAYTSAGSTRVC